MSRVLEPDYSVMYAYSMTGEDVKRIRHALGLNKMAFARMLGTSYQILHRWESGKPISPQYQALLQRVENERLLKSE